MTTAPATPVNYEELIREDESGFWVSGRVYQDPAIFDDELVKIFYRGWSFVGHASEIPQPGDYRTRWIGRQPIIMCRDEDGQIRLLVNRCRHQGATVCQEDRGNTNYFRCAYHGWVYSNRGDLVGVPYPVGYDETFRKEDFGLVEVPRIGVHRGFIFASLSLSGQSFEEYLGRAKDYIDWYCDMAPEGEVLATAGRQKVLVPANWKFQLQNLTDDYHVPITHGSGLRDYTRDWSERRWQMRDFGDGHTILDRWAGNRKVADQLGEKMSDRITGATGTLDPRVIEAVARRVGREKAERMARSGTSHIMVFPNLMLLFNAFRVIHPVRHDLTYLYYYPLFLKGAPADVNERRLRDHEFGFGPAGFINPDDNDMQTRQQLGTSASVFDWQFLNRGRHEERTEADEFGLPALTSPMMNETTARGIWRHYKRVMMQG